jgi:hypothetical protein
MQLYDPQLYALWVEITKGNVKNSSRLILEKFESRYVHTDLNHGAFLRAAAEDAGLREIYRDEEAVLFEVIVQP